jgi:hypothetical protein
MPQGTGERLSFERNIVKEKGRLDYFFKVNCRIILQFPELFFSNEKQQKQNPRGPLAKKSTPVIC